MKAFETLNRGQEVRGKAAGKMTKVGLAFDVARTIWRNDRRWAAKGWLIADLAAYILGEQKDDVNREPLNEQVVVLMQQAGVEWKPKQQ